MEERTITKIDLPIQTIDTDLKESALPKVGDI